MEGHADDTKVPVLRKPNNERINALSDRFKTDFGKTADYYARVPGRVNIIGEHIDYCGYPVLPMALEQDILIAASVIDEPVLRLRNMNEKYQPYEGKFASAEDIKMEHDENGKPYWYNYVLCGVRGAVEYMDDSIKFGVQLYVDGNIPPASGLSSSSALVSASCLSFLYAHGIVPDKTDIAALCARCERYIGTEGGGMDQAIAFLARDGCAQYITWKPLQATPVSLPDNAAFVVAHSLVEANKAATNDFNRRVIECRLAAKIIAHLNGIDVNDVATLSDLQTALDKDITDMPSIVKTHLLKDSYTKADICEILNILTEKLDSKYLTENTRNLNEFKLQQRALHVYEEAVRVEKFRKICSKTHRNTNEKTNGNENGYHNGDATELCTIDSLGKLMSESHQSLKELYECSHGNLDRLVELSESVKVNCRLTGAGWGGCVVALCNNAEVDSYVKTLRNDFYIKKTGINDTNGYVFATKPNYGAVIYRNLC